MACRHSFACSNGSCIFRVPARAVPQRNTLGSRAAMAERAAQSAAMSEGEINGNLQARWLPRETRDAPYDVIRYFVRNMTFTVSQTELRPSIAPEWREIWMQEDHAAKLESRLPETFRSRWLAALRELRPFPTT